MEFVKMSREEQLATLAALKQEYAEAQAKKLSLDLSRGKPGAEQLDLVQDMLDTINSTSDLHAENGFDCRNYGILDGIPEAKRLFADRPHLRRYTRSCECAERAFRT